jgi:hypothetical protein
VICRLFGCAQQQDEQTVPMDVYLSQEEEHILVLSEVEDYL